ncbi:MAG TPA: hypothetical protein VK850_01870 [Candidatus Binatia bacterium]|nr:hypothetical protein [Candidatus Binatia bacterium]
MNSPLYAILWPGTGCLLLLGGILCMMLKKRLFSGSFLVLASLLLGSWQYDRSHETITKLHLAFGDHTLVKANAERPELSIYHVALYGLEMGNWEGDLAAKDIHTTKKPGSIVVAELRKRPLTGTYIKSISDQPLPRYTYVPPPAGREFERAFRQPIPQGVALEHVLSQEERRRNTAKLAIAFRADRVMFDRLRPAELERIGPQEFSYGRIPVAAVDWWRKPTNSTEIWGRNAADYRKYQRRKEDHFACELIIVTWDEDGLMQYFWQGEDLPYPE